MLRTLICFISSLGLAAAWPAIVKAKEDPPMSNTYRYVPKTERPVLSALIKSVLADGHTISVYDTEEYVLKRSASFIAILAKEASLLAELINRARFEDRIPCNDHTVRLCEILAQIEELSA
jgi:hypothetical protein